MSGKRKRISTNTIEGILQDRAKWAIGKIEESNSIPDIEARGTLVGNHIAQVAMVRSIAAAFGLIDLVEEIDSNIKAIVAEVLRDAERRILALDGKPFGAA